MDIGKEFFRVIWPFTTHKYNYNTQGLAVISSYHIVDSIMAEYWYCQ